MSRAVMCSSLLTDAAEHLRARWAAAGAWPLVASAWFSVGLSVHVWSFKRSFDFGYKSFARLCFVNSFSRPETWAFSALAAGRGCGEPGRVPLPRVPASHLFLPRPRQTGSVQGTLNSKAHGGWTQKGDSCESQTEQRVTWPSYESDEGRRRGRSDDKQGRSSGGSECPKRACSHRWSSNPPSETARTNPGARRATPVTSCQ